MTTAAQPQRCSHFLSTDRGFDAIADLRRVDPTDHDAIESLAAA